MKKNIHWIFAAVFGVLLEGCIIDDINAAIDEALGEEGDVACGNILEAMISKIESCSEDTTLKEGETPESKAAEWCQENCDDINDDVQLDDYGDCGKGISDLGCEDIEGKPEQVKTVSGCGWLTSVLEC